MHASCKMSSEPYKAEYQTSMKAQSIVKDLVKTRMPKGQTFDQVQPCPEGRMPVKHCFCNVSKSVIQGLRHGKGRFMADQTCGSNEASKITIV